tara:strand:- start:65 stop:367 length:303 start_codon:yes stop_codon:yes gene_type:complete
MKRYSIPTKTKALNLLKTLELEERQTVSKDIHAIVVWGFEDKQVPILDADGMQTFDEDGLPLFDIIKGLTYNVDIMWKGEQPTEWEQYEVNPSSPSHTVM